MAEFGVKCGKCGRSITDERVEEVLISTDLADRMLNGNYWMTIKLVSELRKLGIPLDHIRINVEEGPEEIDAIANVYGEMVFFELKDQQFSMGHAYAFGGRIGLYRPDKAIIWASEGISKEVMNHFERIKSTTQIYYVHNLDGITEFLESLVNGIIEKIVLEKVFRSIDEGLIIVSLPDLLLRKLGKDVYEKVVDATGKK